MSIPWDVQPITRMSPIETAIADKSMAEEISTGAAGDFGAVPKGRGICRNRRNGENDCRRYYDSETPHDTTPYTNVHPMFRCIFQVDQTTTFLVG
jgi:hypothetical protein